MGFFVCFFFFHFFAFIFVWFVHVSAVPYLARSGRFLSDNWTSDCQSKKRPLTFIVIGSAILHATHPLDVVKRLSKNGEPPICNYVTSRYAIFVGGELLLLLHPGPEIDWNIHRPGKAQRTAPRKLITQGLSGF